MHMTHVNNMPDYAHGSLNADLALFGHRQCRPVDNYRVAKFLSLGDGRLLYRALSGNANKSGRAMVKIQGQKYGLRWAGVRTELIMRDNECVHCRRKTDYYRLETNTYQSNSIHFNAYSDDHVLMTHDHIVPKSLGGGNDLDNAQLMCVICNGRKGARSMEEFKRLPMTTARFWWREPLTELPTGSMTTG